ncbi:MAG: hypothetical protein NTY65_11160 [Planctomycetota bacterium]|nr:hypothetical protein [Planctomycetota bacterium]
MKSNNQEGNQKAGCTLIDLLVLVSGLVPAMLAWHFLLKDYFRQSLEFPVILVLNIAFGVLFWCLIFLWILPAIEKRKKGYSKEK